MQEPHSIRLMVIDDDRAFLGALSRVAEGAGEAMEIFGTASSGADAVALAQASQPDVILLDMGRHADDCIAAIPRLGAACRAQVLMLASVRDPDSTVRVIRAGARGVVFRSDAPETIHKAVRKVREGELWLDRQTTGRIVDALTAARAEAAQPSANGGGEADKLTMRELEVVRALLAHDGAGSRDLAAGLRVSEHTLRNHFTSIYRKLGVPNRTGLFAYASKHGLGAAD
jgi:DNA-binding NarL/FixJ family response regulator